jgi:NarL family two-component system response regulator LiaR
MTTDPEIRVLLVDDHAIVRAGLRYFLASTDDIDIVGEASDAGQAVTMVDALRPDVVLMDLSMPGMNGITAVQQLHHRHPEVRVLMLTNYLEGSLVQHALQAGAVGYLLKVLTMLVTGRSNKQIADQLNISRNTVRRHMQNVLKKLGAANRTEAVVIAVQYGLVQQAEVSDLRRQLDVTTQAHEAGSGTLGWSRDDGDASLV